ncbi:hypothetical protein MSG28_009095 [Choristoneura fumiferana]|uniref:Uncharacterized protein n=1 Tax=Choristoneura fumiferana TaxID=7141 RepID=A0ACC0KWW6_CHOFU|nr:hypothetical protein MSG28_009095 [Choristoneura fumiferana]
MHPQQFGFTKGRSTTDAGHSLVKFILQAWEESHDAIGITLDSKLQWGPHVTAIAGRLSSAAFAVWKIRQLTDVATARLMRRRGTVAAALPVSLVLFLAKWVHRPLLGGIPTYPPVSPAGEVRNGFPQVNERQRQLPVTVEISPTVAASHFYMVPQTRVNSLTVPPAVANAGLAGHSRGPGPREVPKSSPPLLSII